jgi:phenylacetate-CoA ligase
MLNSARTEPFDDVDRLSPAALRQWWARRLGRVLRIAFDELPFYRSRFEAAGFDPAHFRNLDDLGAVPISEKSDFLALDRGVPALRSYTAGPDKRTTVSLSSGTSGTTFVMHTRKWRKAQGYSSSRAHWWAGLRPETPLIMSAPAWHAYASIQPSIAMHFRSPCVVVAGTFLPRFADRIVDAIASFHPKFVTMFLPMVFSILNAARRRNLSGAELFDGVETLVVTGAPITPGMRNHLKTLLRIGRVAEIAGSSENLLAVDCVRGEALHVVPDTCYAEVIDRKSGRAAGDGVRGSVVHSSVIPAGSLYLRYDGGDVGVIDRSPCPCGLPSPRIKLLGRWEDCLTLGGRTILPYDVQAALEEEVPELTGAAFVIIREGLAAGRLRIVLAQSEGGRAGLLEEAQSSLKRRFMVEVEVVAVRDLPLRFKGVPPVMSEQEASTAV